MGWMTRLHAGDRRQREPYACHPLRVAIRILSHYRVTDPDVAGALPVPVPGRPVRRPGMARVCRTHVSPMLECRSAGYYFSGGHDETRASGGREQRDAGAPAAVGMAVAASPGSG